LFGNPDRRRPLGSPRRRWNIEINPRKFSLKVRFILAENWKWLVVPVNTLTYKFNASWEVTLQVMRLSSCQKNSFPCSQLSVRKKKKVLKFIGYWKLLLCGLTQTDMRMLVEVECKRSNSLCGLRKNEERLATSDILCQFGTD
jgi:hypothetical protein